MTIYVPQHVAAALELQASSGKLPYARKLPTSGQDYERMRRAEMRRRLRVVRNLGSK